MEKYQELMRMCLIEAQKYRFDTAPNPMVAAIVYDEANDRIVSLGSHKKYGGKHAEVDAVERAGDIDFSQMTIVVNLEPCSHFGKTPPCADLIIEKGFKKAVVGMLDPNPLVGGNGIKKLKDAGIEVVTGILERECRELNKVFVKNVTKKLPYITLKSAVTFDSKIATVSGESKWITNEVSREEVQRLRGEYFAILSGSGTVLADNPALSCRIKGAHIPDRIIVDRHGKISFDYRVFNDDGARVFLATNNLNRDFPKNVIPVDFSNFKNLFSKLYEHGVYSIFVETGRTVLSALIKQKQSDEIYKFTAPVIFGSGMDFIGDIGVVKINEALRLEFFDIKKFDGDILIQAKIRYDE